MTKQLFRHWYWQIVTDYWEDAVEKVLEEEIFIEGLSFTSCRLKGSTHAPLHVPLSTGYAFAMVISLLTENATPYLRTETPSPIASSSIRSCW